MPPDRSSISGRTPRTGCTRSQHGPGFAPAIVSGGKVSGETAPKAVSGEPVDRTSPWCSIRPDAQLIAYVDGARAGEAANVDGQRGADRQPDRGRVEPALPRTIAGRQRADAARPAARRAPLSDRADRSAGRDDPHQRDRRRVSSGARARHAAPVISTAAIPRESPLAAQLSHVPDITVETVVGMLPRLPRDVPAVYRGQRQGAGGASDLAVAGGHQRRSRARQLHRRPARCRAPPSRRRRRSSSRRRVGTTTPPEPAGGGVSTQPSRARSRRQRPRDAVHAEPRQVPSRPGGQQSRQFLYNFRDAFGQPQPPGAQQLEGWDNQTTRLRGHASGHYLTAIAQAYASTTYDEALRANFLQKMNYLIDTLYDLSQKSGKPEKPGGPSVADPTAVPPGPGRERL